MRILLRFLLSFGEVLTKRTGSIQRRAKLPQTKPAMASSTIAQDPSQEKSMKSRNSQVNYCSASHFSHFSRLKTLSSSAMALLTLSLLVAMVSNIPASANTLNSSGPLQLPSNCSSGGCGNGQPGVFPNVINNSGAFTGTFPSSVDPGYGGQFTGTGPYPAKNGTNNFDFTTLTHGSLQSGTMIYFGDLDHGSGSEDFTLQAFDASHTLIQSAWLEDVFYVSGANPADFVQGSMPEYKWTSGTGTYKFDGANVLGNPTVGVWLTTNTDIGYLTVTSDTANASFGIAAPAPEPGTLLLLGSGAIGLGGLFRRSYLP
jgi:hypothetical protein